MFNNDCYDTQIKNKENELIQMLQDKISLFENRLREKDHLIVKLDEKNNKIIEDFEFNLNVIKKRDDDIIV